MTKNRFKCRTVIRGLNLNRPLNVYKQNLSKKCHYVFDNCRQPLKILIFSLTVPSHQNTSNIELISNFRLRVLSHINAFFRAARLYHHSRLIVITAAILLQRHKKILSNNRILSTMLNCFQENLLSQLTNLYN